MIQQKEQAEVCSYLENQFIVVHFMRLWVPYSTFLPHPALRVFKITGKLVAKYDFIYTKGTLKQRPVKDLSNDAYAMLLCFLIFLIKAYIVGTHLNCIDKSMQFKWVPTTYTFIKTYTKITLAVIWRLQNCLTVRL